MNIIGDEIREIAYLEPLAKLLDVKFGAFTPHRDGGAYLYGGAGREKDRVWVECVDVSPRD
jgi:hypothetical protein